MFKRQTLFEIDNDLCKIKAELIDDTPEPFVHVEMKSWGKREMKLIKFVISQVRQALKDMGFQFALSLIPNDAKTLKFNKLCGMKEFRDLDGLVLLRMEL